MLVISGSMIIVVGIVHPSNTTVPPAIASYIIDSNSTTTLPLPVATHDIPNQQFFHSPQLTPGEHTLTINVTSDDSPYTLDYLFICGSGGPAVSGTAKLSGDPPENQFVSKSVVVVIASIMGAMMIVFLGVLVYLLWLSRRNRFRKKRQTTPSPLREWLARRTSCS